MLTTDRERIHVPNHRIEALFRESVPFTNYNGTITCQLDESGNLLKVVHWSTHMGTWNRRTSKWVYLNLNYISNTTSTLQGKMLRALGTQSAFIDYVSTTKYGDTKRLRQIKKMTSNVWDWGTGDIS